MREENSSLQVLVSPQISSVFTSKPTESITLAVRGSAWEWCATEILEWSSGQLKDHMVIKHR